MAFEDEFVVEIPDATAEKILSVPDAVECNNYSSRRYFYEKSFCLFFVFFFFFF